MSKKKTITIPEYQEEFLEENDLSPSKLLQEKIDEIIENVIGTKKQGEFRKEAVKR